MGIFSFLTKTAVSGVKKAAKTAFDINPIVSTTRQIKSFVKAPKGERLSALKKQTIKQAKLNLTVAALVAPLAVAPAAVGGAAGAAAKSIFIGKTALGTAGRIGTGVLVAGALSKSPKLRKQAIDIPSKVFTQGEKIGELVEEPKATFEKEIKDKSFIDVVKTFGVKAGVPIALGAGAVALAPTVISKAKDILGKDKKIPEPLPKLIPLAPNKALKTEDVVTGTAPVAVATPQLEQKGVGTVKKKRKVKRRSRKPTQIRQSVRVNVNNKNTTKYLNQRNYK